MWRWVTRGLVFTVIALCASAMLAQTFEFHGDLDAPDPQKTHSGLVLVQGWALDPITIDSIELYVDDQFQHKAIMFLPRIDVEQAYPDWPGIHNARPGFITGFLASRFPNGSHTVEIRARTADGKVHSLGRRTVNINNSINQPPFGFLDIPDGFGVINASGAFPVSAGRRTRTASRRSRCWSTTASWAPPSTVIPGRTSASRSPISAARRSAAGSRISTRRA